MLRGVSTTEGDGESVLIGLYFPPPPPFKLMMGVRGLYRGDFFVVAVGVGVVAVLDGVKGLLLLLGVVGVLAS